MMDGYTPYEVGGIKGPSRQQRLIDLLQGGTAVSAPPMQADTPAAPPSAPTGLGQYAGRLEGFDSGKLNSSHNSPKYQIGRALSNFDPRQGVTQDVLAALNGLGIGQFSGSGDRVSIANGDPRFEGVTSLDLVRGFHDPNGTGGWQYGAEGGPMASSGVGGPAAANIGLALGNLGNPGAEQSLLQQIIASLRNQ